MTPKIKLTAGILALTAGLAVWQFLSTFKVAVVENRPSQDTSASLTPDLFSDPGDTDHDGLTDQEESYWGTDFQNPDTDGDGFKDGEEVATDHDPTVAGPKDSLRDENLTDVFSTLTFSGLVEGSLKPNNPAYRESLDTLTATLAHNALKAQGAKADRTRIHTIASNNATHATYVSEATDVIQRFLKELGGQLFYLQNASTKSDSDIQIYFQSEAANLDSLANEAYAISVPQPWMANDISLIESIVSLGNIDASLAAAQTDPLRSVAALQGINIIIETVPQILRSYVAQIRAEQLRTGQELISLMANH